MTVSPFQNLATLMDAFNRRGVIRILCKPLVQNDNTKQQIYLGSSFEVLKLLPSTKLEAESDAARPSFKASMRLTWIDASIQEALAPGAQLILYPDYPEVRLSGFLRGCQRAPSEYMQPVASTERRASREADGRVLFLAVQESGMVFAYVAGAGSQVSKELLDTAEAESLVKDGVFYKFEKKASTRELLKALRPICGDTWHPAQRRLTDGSIIKPYNARSSCGYTLESLLGILPNARPEPDLLGWEIKACRNSRITLFAPEPDSGFCGDHGVAEFVAEYGRNTKPGVRYFTGQHRVGIASKASKQTLWLDGFDAVGAKIDNVKGSITLIDVNDVVTARWTFAALIEHWMRKHAAVAYIPYLQRDKPTREYQFSGLISLGEGTDFFRFLKLLDQGRVIFDPGSNIKKRPDGLLVAKGRNQFRVRIKDLPNLYSKFSPVMVHP